MDIRTPLLAPVLASLIAAGMALPTLAQISPSTITPADLRKYVSSSITLSFMATGVSALDDCATPLEFREGRKGALQILEILCTSEAEPRFARLTFIRYTTETGTIGLSPFRIEFLP
ncbi:MAG: LarC family nickel insertion protein [Alphaproteobacteria bacterium]|nr:LarC family nickel insertion protein [Alphaproteobacteria bacterium]